MDYQVIIISQKYYELTDQLSSLILDKCFIVDDNSLIYDNQTYYFNYLIIDDDTLVSNLKLEKDDNFIITNYYQETSANNIFAIGDIVKTNRSLKEQLEIIVNYIIDGE